MVSEHSSLEELEKLNKQLTAKLSRRTSQLNRTQSILQTIMAITPNYIQMLDEDLRYTFINRTGKGILQEQFIGKPFGMTLKKNDRDRVNPLLREILKGHPGHTYEYTAQLPDGVHWYKSVASPLIDDDKVTGVIVTSFDITDEKLTESRLIEDKQKAEAERLKDRAMMDSIGEGLVVIDETGRIANVNPSGAAMLGYAPHELVGKWFTTTIIARDELDEVISPMERPVMRALSSGSPVTDRALYVCKDGSKIPVALTISPVILEGRPIGAIEVFRDTTRERELDHAKEEFVSLASHQLRTPATGIKAYISMLLDGYGGDLNSEQKGFLQRVYDSNERQLQVVNDMLNVARLDAGRIIPEMTTIELKQLLIDVIDEQKAVINQRSQNIAIDIPARSIEAVMDGKLIRMVAENLLSNASKYTSEKGIIQIGASVSGTTVQISIKDTGVGIAKEDISKLFQRFSRIPNILSTSRGGTGLGLYLTQNIVLLHSGELRVDSTLGKGTTFTVVLPIKPPKKKRN